MAISRISLQHTITIDFQMQFDKKLFRLTAVYGPPSQTGRHAFFAELQSSQPSADVPWIVLGDFNQTINLADRSNSARRPDGPFASLIAGLALIDLPLIGRQYTWSRGTHNPTFVRLDRVFISNSWSSQYPNTSQRALQSTLSDHCPLQCVVNTGFQLPNMFRFENYWLKIAEFNSLIHTTWNEMDLATTPLQLSSKFQTLRREIKTWHKAKVGSTRMQIETCNKVLMWLTAAEENRQLNNLEQMLRTMLTERLEAIEDLAETKWKQRAKKQWTQQGDRNTRYFHAVATHQKRMNTISSVMHNEAEVTNHNSKAAIFFDFFCKLIGTQSEGMLNFDLERIYATDKLSQTEVDSLRQPWTDLDITQAIRSWKSNKSPGPDGFTAEFYNTFTQLLLPDLREVFRLLNQQPQATLYPLNDSHIVLVPKKKPALTPHDYRPISLVNAVQKLYSKIMATKLKPLLDKLLSPTQTGFLKNRSILHTFHYAQQIVQTAAKQKTQVAAFKADVFKAFDTLDWDFLLRSLAARAFPQEWIQSVKNRVLMGSSKIVINSVAGRTITLKRGVRQGDPLSPYLFNLAIDFLPRWICKLNELHFLSSPLPHCRTCLLYADDTLLFLKPTASQIIKTKLVFDTFGKISGLTINLHKSELSITSSPLSLAQQLATVMQCKSTAFPIKYLGLPLSEKRLTRADYFPVIDRVQLALTTWKAALLSIAGRAILINAVLSSIPQYHMSVFLFPKWVLKKIDQIRRTFLWHGHKNRNEQAKGLYMVNWRLATRPRNLGGLGIRDIYITNQALLMKWIWQWHTQHSAWWRQVTTMEDDSERPWNDVKGSHFWKSISHIAPAFECSVAYQIGQGNKVKFWHDSWLGKPLKYQFPTLYQAALHKNYSVQQNKVGQNWNLQFQNLTVEDLTQKELLLARLQNVPNLPGQDEITWCRNPPTFSASSAYKFLSYSPSPTSTLAQIWKIRAPLRVLIFVWLLTTNRLTTIDNLARRGWYLPSICIMCQRSEETTKHLFQTCQMAIQIRDYIYTAFAGNYPIPLAYKTVSSNQLLLDENATPTAKQWEIVTCFILWRERCRRTFSDSFRSQMALVREARAEYSLWFEKHPIGLP